MEWHPLSDIIFLKGHRQLEGSLENWKLEYLGVQERMGLPSWEEYVEAMPILLPTALPLKVLLVILIQKRISAAGQQLQGWELDWVSKSIFLEHETDKNFLINTAGFIASARI